MWWRRCAGTQHLLLSTRVIALLRYFVEKIAELEASACRRRVFFVASAGSERGVKSVVENLSSCDLELCFSRDCFAWRCRLYLWSVRLLLIRGRCFVLAHSHKQTCTTATRGHGRYAKWQLKHSCRRVLKISRRRVWLFFKDFTRDVGLGFID